VPFVLRDRRFIITKREVLVDFVERLFGVAPDGENGNYSAFSTP
jgi:hypothetical protein